MRPDTPTNLESPQATSVQSSPIDERAVPAPDAPPPAMPLAPGLPRWRARLCRVLPALFVIVSALLLWVLITGGAKTYLWGIRFSATGAGNPTAILVILAAAYSLAKHGREGIVGRTALRLTAHVRAASWPARCGLALCVWVGVVHIQALINLKDTLEPPHKAPVESALQIQVNSANLHAFPLLDTLVRGSDVGPFVVRIHDMDPRGHEVGFYLYPRLLRMEPSERRWGLRDRMLHLELTPPEERAKERPTLGVSRAFAHTSHQPLVIAAPESARVDLPGAETAAQPAPEAPKAMEQQ